MIEDFTSPRGWIGALNEGVVANHWHKMRLEPIILPAFVVVVAVGLATCFPLAGNRILSRIERLGSCLASRKRLAICSVAIAVVLSRIALLWFVPVPVPEVHDEFSYLLAADTFAHGNLTNPEHPMWFFFDTFHVNQLPTYMSKYPPAQGAVLALGQVLGHPWIGVVLSMAAMCAAVLWMLQGWLPPSWAFLGSLLVVLRIGIFSYWMNSFWGGTVAAIGGALVAGALPRIIRFKRSSDAVLLAVGAAILANSRPFEGLIFCIPVFFVLAVWLIRNRHAQSWETITGLIVPFSSVAVLCVVFMGYYNWRGTGSPFIFPYMVNDKTYLSTPLLLWQKLRPALHYGNPQFEAFYNEWGRASWLEGRPSSIHQLCWLILRLIKKFVGFFIWPEFTVPLVALPWVFRDRRVRFLLFQFVFCFLAFLLVAWFQPHYAAPLTATFFALLVQAFRHLRRWQSHGSPIGIGLSRAVVLCAVVLAPFNHLNVDLYPNFKNRARLETQLEHTPGEHLVIVRYTPQHDSHQEWVYNRANIDQSKVIWAREIPGTDIQPLLHYFQGRRIWLVEPDQAGAELSPYTLIPRH